MVEYWSLVTEDGFQPLREHVDLCHLRSLPPDAGVLEFEVGDVVDADYRDGWWTGVVRKVMGCDRYRVFFENPPDLIEFEKNQMRFHQDWVNGKWVRPKKEQVLYDSTSFLVFLKYMYLYIYIYMLFSLVIILKLLLH